MFLLSSGFETVKDIFLQCSRCFFKQANAPRGSLDPQCHLVSLWGPEAPYIGGVSPVLMCRTPFGK